MAESRIKSAVGPFLMISGHDYRTKRQVNIHFIVHQLAGRGTTRFFSAGFSWLSRIKTDPRASLWDSANRVESINGVETYLWRSLIHPVNLRWDVLSQPSAIWFKTYARNAPDTLRKWIRDSNTILIESGIGVVFFELIKEINPKATTIYICSDALDTIGCSPFLGQELRRVSPSFDHVCAPSKLLISEFTRKENVIYVPHGISLDIYRDGELSPYPSGTHLVSVGSMLFDRSFFEIAAPEFPEITFHVIGGGKNAKALTGPNIIIYSEMPFQKTIGYIRYAKAGIAPYLGSKVAPYLVDTSMKLMQFGFFGIPAICPHIAVGTHKERFGYEPGNRNSIVSAIKSAVAYGHFAGKPFLSWQEVTDRILAPSMFSDTPLYS
jgi:2-beta-glucuronyltransferase